MTIEPAQLHLSVSGQTTKPARTTPHYRQWRARLQGAEFVVMRLQEGPTSEYGKVLDTPEATVEYLQSQIHRSISYRPDVENVIAVYLTVRRCPIGWQVISNGTLDTLLVTPREVYKHAFVLNAATLIIAHNHPSGDPTPSEADVKVTRDLIRAGQLIKVELVDHLILGQATVNRPKGWSSLRELGYFYS